MKINVWTFVISSVCVPLCSSLIFISHHNSFSTFSHWCLLNLWSTDLWPYPVSPLCSACKTVVRFWSSGFLLSTNHNESPRATNPPTPAASVTESPDETISARDQTIWLHYINKTWILCRYRSKWSIEITCDQLCFCDLSHTMKDQNRNIRSDFNLSVLINKCEVNMFVFLSQRWRGGWGGECRSRHDILILFKCY